MHLFHDALVSFAERRVISMKTIFLMRHGETLFNVMDVNQGQCDSPLTENGINQALAAKEWFKN